MVQPQEAHAVKRNQLLGALEPAARKRIDPHLELASFQLGDLVCEAGGILQHAYFPQGCVLSLLTALENGDAIETANIGREGAFGLLAAMYSRVSFNRCIVQLAGPMVRCKIEVLQSELKRSEHVRRPLRQLLRDAAVRSSRPSPATRCTRSRRGRAAGCS